MSSGADRARWLTEAANLRGGELPAARDLDMWGYLDVRRREVAEHILWEQRSTLLAAFDELRPALDGPKHAAESPEVPMQPATTPVAHPEAPTAPEDRFRLLLEWRALHRDSSVSDISDLDLGRLASSGASSRAEIEAVAPRMNAHQAVARHAGELAKLLGGQAKTPEPTPPAPAPAPSPKPAPAARRVADPFAPLTWERVTQFAPYQWSDTPAMARGNLLVELDDDGVARLAWSAAPGDGVTLYRLVESATTWPSGAPEVGALVGVTRATSGSVRLRSSQAVTYLAVWANRGATEVEATHTQPVLVGVGQIVWPPRELTYQVTPARTVTATLTAPAGSRVEVQRFLKGETINYDINREIDRTNVSTTGFRDLTPPMGEDLVYAVFCVADLSDGSCVVSPPVTVEAHVTPETQQIQVQVRASETSPGAYDITWMRPAHGKVVLFATPDRPQVGLENEPRTAEIIEGQGLTAAYRISYPPVDLGGLMTIRDFSVDPTWVRAHFVAVHWVSDDSVWVGPTVSMVTPHAPGYAQIVERVDSQIITFAWPEGVTVVQAYQGPRGQSVDPNGAEPIAHLTRDQYVRMGGMRITRTLPSNGCAINLYAVVYLDGRPMYSEPTALDYPGITRLRYTVTGYGADGMPVQATLRPVSYRIYAEVDDDLHETPLAVVGQIGRLPLHPQDGRTLAQPVVSLRAGISTYLAELPAGQNLVFLRLFVDLPPAECGAVAVLDPPVYTLEAVL